MNENVVKLENNFNQVIERKIAVIFVTDVVGFSKLMEINEDETLKSFRACKHILDKLFAEHGGRIFNTAGDAVLAEFQSVPKFDYKLGQTFNVNLFSEGDFVSVSGKSKGRGFSGTIKKYSFSTQRKTHGQGDTHRHVGSIGAASDPSRVFPGKKMPGRYGNKTVSVKGLEVMRVSVDKNQLLIKGNVPGATNGIVYITR